MESLSDDNEAEVSLLRIKEINHSLSLILGLGLTVLVLTHLGTVDKMTTSLGAGAGLETFSLFGARAASATTFCF